MDNEADNEIFSRVDLDHYILEKTDATLDEDIDHEIEIFKNALDFS